MALATTDQFCNFYSQDNDPETPEQQAAKIFRILLESPWMSSGLTDNNAFTTTLVLRAYGFLEQERIFGLNSPKPDSTEKGRVRAWDLHLGIRDVIGLANKLRGQSDPASEFLWLSVSDNTRNLIQKGLKSNMETVTRLKAALGLDLRRVIQSGWIFDENRFTKASATTKQKLALKPTGYKLALVNHLLLTDQFPDEFSEPAPRSLKAIAAEIAQDATNFSINEYPPSAAVVYWFVDGIDRAGINLTPTAWAVLCRWAAKEFNHRRSLVAAEHDAMMDPVAMAMSACLCARLRTIAGKTGRVKTHLTTLPSFVELERSIGELISKQTKSGIWNKYFPLFHYQDAGSNFCFTFELLEAVLHEFRGKESKLLASPDFAKGLMRAVTWCEENRLHCPEGSAEYAGWNSGGQIETLERGYPEAWATAVVHMFLSELTTVLSERIQQDILRKYRAREPEESPKSPVVKGSRNRSTALSRLLDIDLLLPRKVAPLLSLLRMRLVDTHRRESEATLRRRPLKEPLSALLFGPPGTSKTQIAKAVAEDLNWPLVEITPSEFLKGTLANIYLQADEIFDDLMDLSGVVVFFDEMDALVQTREGETQLDIASQFLTTTMLPKLTRLHDRGRVVFFMATNFQDRFDAAIKRAGRFDLLLCTGPPKLSEKLNRLHIAYLLPSHTPKTKKAMEKIKEYLEGKPQLQDQLGLYTFDEFKAFLKTFGDQDTIGDKIEESGALEFQSRLEDYSNYVSLKIGDLEPLKEIGFKWKRIASLDKKSFTLKQLKSEATQIIRYFCDRKESKEQY
jgi:hypothetical protein